MNGEVISTTPEHPFWVPQKGWTAAVKLRAGDILVTVNGEYVVVEKVQHEILESPISVYNFEVQGFHTYFVASNTILVHNRCQPELRHTPDQQAVIELAKEYEKTGVNTHDAELLVGWADEYGIDNHLPMIHETRSGKWSYTYHIKVFKYHIPVTDYIER